MHGAICAVDGKKTFTDVTLNGLWTGWSGFSDTFDQRHRHQVGVLSRRGTSHEISQTTNQPVDPVAPLVPRACSEVGLELNQTPYRLA